MAEKRRSANNNFNKLMKTFHVSGMKLADVLHLDPSLISKWKNGRRNLAGNTSALNQIAELFVHLDAGNEYRSLSLLLGTAGLDSMSAEKIKNLLKLWLAMPAELDVENCSYETYEELLKGRKRYEYIETTGNAELRTAITSFLDASAQVATDSEIWSYMIDDGQWFFEEEDYVPLWLEANMRFISCGGNIHAVHSMFESPDKIARHMLAWLPLYLTGKVYPYFVPTLHGSFYDCTVVLRDKMAIKGIQPSNRSTDMTVLSFGRGVVLDALYEICRSASKNAIRLFNYFYRQDGLKYGEILRKAANIDEDQYGIMSFPFVNVIPTEEIEELLLSNNLEETMIKETVETCRILKMDYRKGGKRSFRYILSKERIEKMLTEKRCVVDTLSVLTGKTIYIENAFFREMIKRMVRMLRGESSKIIHQVVLLEDNNLQGLNQLSMFVKKNSIISIYNNTDTLEKIEDDRPMILVSNEIPVIQALYDYCGKMWRKTLPQNRDPFFVARQLNMMEQSLGPPEAAE